MRREQKASTKPNKKISGLSFSHIFLSYRPVELLIDVCGSLELILHSFLGGQVKNCNSSRNFPQLSIDITHTLLVEEAAECLKPFTVGLVLINHDDSVDEMNALP